MLNSPSPFVIQDIGDQSKYLLSTRGLKRPPARIDWHDSPLTKAASKRLQDRERQGEFRRNLSSTTCSPRQLYLNPAQSHLPLLFNSQVTDVFRSGKRKEEKKGNSFSSAFSKNNTLSIWLWLLVMIAVISVS